MASRAFTRSLATATKSVKPPIQLYGLDGTYANALYSASVQDSSVETSFQSLSKINTLIETDPKVKDYLTNPALSKLDRAEVIKIVSSNLKLDETTTNFLTVLSQNNRLANFKSIYEKFALLNDAHNGVVEAKVTSAKPLDSKILKRLQTAIQKSEFIGEGKTLKLSNPINPEILGGLVVEVGDKTVDLSIQAKVAKLNQSLKEAL
ncbi:F1F0-ATPase subunit [Scheffersomyces coipomensis]|uniref:F1F0-ATPase subunit n=1 Tax=Scheffersomyces coipomensis TaxID=1788519 RepID=UPI00315D500B